MRQNSFLFFIIQIIASSLDITTESQRILVEVDVHSPTDDSSGSNATLNESIEKECLLKSQNTCDSSISQNPEDVIIELNNLNEGISTSLNTTKELVIVQSDNLDKKQDEIKDTKYLLSLKNKFNKFLICITPLRKVFNRFNGGSVLVGILFVLIIVGVIIANCSKKDKYWWVMLLFLLIPIGIIIGAILEGKKNSENQ